MGGPSRRRAIRDTPTIDVQRGNWLQNKEWMWTSVGWSYGGMVAWEDAVVLHFLACLYVRKG